MQGYKVGDLFIRIKNAVMARRNQVSFNASKMARQIINVLEKQGFLTNIKEESEGAKKFITADIVMNNRVAVFSDVSIISKPSLRIYMDTKKLIEKQRKSVGQLIVSTSQGIMTGKEAIEKKLGGEVLVEIW
jgi:small subunit ribosomal protein S8